MNKLRVRNAAGVADYAFRSGLIKPRSKQDTVRPLHDRFDQLAI